ncbi:dipeptide/oligopeptide/nickel ABC transporter permease/ATP-binding protein [Halomonas sp. ANAO-440]|uniref:dipeptide/oligopeptide/nickel ABC transporter permease/ATP-binding protein n=1 Tax=Halomonas sp. ANAO-440 TaxID=2861360 RepID=UPI001CAA620B|nr:dipeptide/oligopeptide/nickel ABC transporter permease/ATP-binding protein [Halomonas sp. ANAO-440]MBZ0332183.1 dipeptide/oligopeptide/nickel ABC transporter permease/ATP-binding protein [Halomonas sp. ANAO-440]
MTDFIRLIARNRLAAFGGVLLVLLVLLCLITPWLPLADPNSTSPANRLQPPLTEGHLLGTDALGRDILSRLLWGTRISLAVGIAASLVAAFFGSLIGIVAGYFGGRTDNTLMRGIDMLMAFPYILLALAIVAVLGPGLMNALYAIAIVNIPFFARNIRGVTVSIAHREFIDAARLSGKGHLRILTSEILPNVLPVIVITMSTTVGWMILETAGLSFLGLGAQPPQADLGSMLGEGRRMMLNAPHVAILPGLVIFLLVMSINLLGDGIRDALDPRLKSGALSRPAPFTRIRRRQVPSKKGSDTHALLDVEDLHTHFEVGRRTYRAVNGVSFAIRPNECLGLVGESGSGKSVTALSLLGLVASPPGVITGGRIALEGRDLLDLPHRAIRRIRGRDVAYVFQDPLSTLHPLFRVGDQLVEAIQQHQPMSRQAARERAVSLLNQVRIPNAERRAEQYPHELSGGMRQRVGIAMALANDPQLIVADEPTTALDVTVQAQILALIKNLRESKGTAVLFITHDFGVVSQVCDRVAVMYAGRIVEIGPTADILDNPRHPYTRRLIDCVPRLGEPDNEPAAIPGLPPPADALPEGCAFADRCDLAEDACRRGEVGLNATDSDRQVRCIKPLGLETRQGVTP